MKSSANLLYRVQQIIGSMGEPGRPLDETSRKILLQIAHNQCNGKTTCVSDITREKDYGTAPTIYTRLKKLAEMDLVHSTRNPEDGRSNTLRLTPAAARLLKKQARAIRAASAV